MAASITKNVITLKGSTAIVAEFFDYAINSILYQRGLYPPEDFARIEKYGLTLLVTDNEKLKTYLSTILKQIQEWLLKKQVQRVVLVVVNTSTGETLERWDFVIQCDDNDKERSPKEKDIKVINEEIRAVIRQITASVTFLPLLEGPCAFDILLYADKDIELVSKWEDSANRAVINNAEEVRLRSLSTGIHAVDTIVSYRRK